MLVMFADAILRRCNDFDGLKAAQFNSAQIDDRREGNRRRCFPCAGTLPYVAGYETLMWRFAFHRE